MKIDRERPLIYTNLFFLAPLVIAIRNQNFGIAIAIALVTILSTLYHIFKSPGSEWWWNSKGRTLAQTFLLVSEITLSFILAVWSAVFLFQRPVIWIVIAYIIFIPSFIMYLSTNYKKYVLYHSVWHLAMAMIIIIALI